MKRDVGELFRVKKDSPSGKTAKVRNKKARKAEKGLKELGRKVV